MQWQQQVQEQKEKSSVDDEASWVDADWSGWPKDDAPLDWHKWYNSGGARSHWGYWGGGGSGYHGKRDYDPPEQYGLRDMKEHKNHFRKWRKALEVWRLNTDTEQVKQGGQLMESLKNYALEVVDHVPPMIVYSVKGCDVMIELLDSAAGFREHSELKRSLHNVLQMPW